MRLVALAGFLVALLFIAYGVWLLGGFGAITPRLTVGRLRHELAEFSDDLPVAAIYDNGAAGGRVVAVQPGLDPDDNCHAILLVVD